MAGRRRCGCGEPADDLCAWLVPGFVPVGLADLREGDWIERGAARARVLEIGEPRVLEVRAFMDSKLRLSPLQAFIAERDGHLRPPPAGSLVRMLRLDVRPPLTLPYKIAIDVAADDATVRAQRLVPCGQPVCDLCGRDPGEGHRLCDDHRSEWEKVA